MFGDQSKLTIDHQTSIITQSTQQMDNQAKAILEHELMTPLVSDISQNTAQRRKHDVPRLNI